jgi:p-aminobenzoyl-glutamate transporter AbgT
MNAIWYGIGNAATALFEILPPIGPLTNWFFGIAITVGVTYWLWYDAKVKKGGANFMADKGK